MSEMERKNLRRATREAELSDRQLLEWGALGGLLFVAVNAGLFNLKEIEGMVTGSRPVVQLATLTIFSLAILGAGAVWAKVHKPLRSTFVALQLGVIAPLAINAMVSPLKDAANTGGPASSSSPAKISDLRATPAPEERTRGISITSVLGTEPTAGPTIIKCIIKSLVKQAC